MLVTQSWEATFILFYYLRMEVNSSFTLTHIFQVTEMRK